ncbi:MAG: MmgE/PrpD family protein, partial [Candidatus Micrarchaeaceae archaeon]
AGELSMWKAVSFPNAARNAIFSAKLASNGMTGPSPIFEGEMGFWKQVSGKFILNTNNFGSKSNKFLITKRITKYYPAEIRSQSAITAAITAGIKIHNISDIKKIEILTTESGYKVLGKDKEKWSPKTKETADHSLPFIVCSALLYKNINLESYKESRLLDKKIISLLKLTSVKEQKELTELYPKCIPNEVKITLKNNTVVDETVLYQKGHPKNPMNDYELENKFKLLASRNMSNKKINILLKELRNFESIKNISRLFELTR